MEKALFVFMLFITVTGFIRQPAGMQFGDQYPIDILSVGEQIKQARLAKQVSREALAQAVGLLPYNIKRIEQGKAVPTRLIIRKIEVFLDCTIRIESIKR